MDDNGDFKELFEKRIPESGYVHDFACDLHQKIKHIGCIGDVKLIHNNKSVKAGIIIKYNCIVDAVVLNRLITVVIDPMIKILEKRVECKLKYSIKIEYYDIITINIKSKWCIL